MKARVQAIIDTMDAAADSGVDLSAIANVRTMLVDLRDRPSKVEILHVRDPDSECYQSVFLDGVPVPDGDVAVADVDPGRGHERESWDENIAAYRDPEVTSGLSPAFRASVVEALEQNSDSQFIVEVNR